MSQYFLSFQGNLEAGTIKKKTMATPLKEVSSTAIDSNKEELEELSVGIWSNPELYFEEYKAHELLTSFLEKKGFTVERSYTGIKTAFRATFGSGRPNMCVISEYDALPEIGHACGHNLIAEAGVAAGLGLKRALETSQGAIKGTVTVLGTPAEEGGGGKVELIKNGAFSDIDVAMMVHPFPDTLIRPIYIAAKFFTASYTGKTAHAAAYPWEGVNALDAAVMAYNSISVLRQQMKPTWRVHCIISKGGVKPNIIPESSEIEIDIRAPSVQEVENLVGKVTSCFEAASLSTGCELKIDERESFYRDVRQNSSLAKEFGNNLSALGVQFGDIGDMHASTDMGNVSYVVPSLHPNYAIGSGEVNHTEAFTGIANTPDAHHKTLQAAKAMAHTAIDVLVKDGLLDKIKEDFTKQIQTIF